jgi:phosphatidylinositol alpha 1,6-mannosyltransferase
MRIALFTETFLPKIDGIVNTLCHVLDHLSLRGHTSMLFAPQGGPYQYADTQVIGMPTIPFPPYPELRLVPPIVGVRDSLAEFKPDLVHLVNPVSLGVAGLHAARRLNIPVVASYQTDIPGFVRRWGMRIVANFSRVYLRWLHNQMDLNLTPSRVTRDQLLAEGFKRVRVWERGVDTFRFHPSRRTEEWRRRLSDGDTSAPILLYVGRLSPEKRVDWLRPVLNALPQTRLAIVGDGPARPNLERVFAGTSTVFTGYLKGRDLYQAYASADVFTFPSPNETVGNVVLEAMASAVPVVAPRSGGLLDHVTDGENGLLFAPEDQDDWVAQISKLVYNPEYARQLGAAGRRHTQARDWPTTLDGLLDDYRSVIDAYHPQRRSRLSGPARQRAPLQTT